MSRVTKRSREESESESFSVPNFEPTSFGECSLPYDRAQSDSIDLWLFKLPPELTAESLTEAGVVIPTETTIKMQLEAQEALANEEPHSLDLYRKVPKGYHKIASFTHKNMDYTLYETPASESESMVNLWTSDDKKDDGEVVRGKPFARYFVVLIDTLSTAAQYATGPIPFMPMGYNTPFEPKPIALPIGLTNPYTTNPKNIIDMHKKDDFQFTAGNMAQTIKHNHMFLNPSDKKESLKSEPVAKKQKKDKSQVKTEIKTESEVKSEKKSKKEKKRDKDSK